MNTIFKVGQKVYSPHYGWGEVIEIDETAKQFPITVVFDSGGAVYTIDGKSGAALPRSLFFAEPQITPEMLNPPFDIKEGDLCYFWNYTFRTTVFDRFIRQNQDGRFQAGGSNWDCCCKYPELPPHLKP